MPQTAVAINIFHDRQYQKAQRIYHHSSPNFEISLSDRVKASLDTRKKSKSAKMALLDQRKRLANEHFGGNVQALKMSDLRRETQDLIEILNSVKSKKVIEMPSKHRAPLPVVDGKKIKRTTKTPKRKITLKQFAEEQSFALGICSSKVIYQYWPDKDKTAYKHSVRCGRRNCSVCGHFNSLDEAKMMQRELLDKLQGLNADQRERGRLMHIILTHENVTLDKVFDIMRVWRHIQQMKKRIYKKKENPYRIWEILSWGLMRWEVTRNEETGLYHPHLHILAWVDGWLDSHENGYWSQLVHSWVHTCKTIADIEAKWDGQDYELVAFFGDSKHEKSIRSNASEDIMTSITSGAVFEMSKYPLKSTDFTKLTGYKKGDDISDQADELAELLAIMYGRKLKNGFGGFKLREIEEGTKVEPEPGPGDYINPDYTDELSYECIYTWDRSAKIYKLYKMREWNEERFKNYIDDLRDYKAITAVVMEYGLRDS